MKMLDRRADAALLIASGNHHAEQTKRLVFQLAIIGGVAGFTAGALLARQIGRSIFSSQITIQPVLFPIILTIAVLVTFAGSAAAIRRAVKFDPVFALRGEG